MEALPGENEPGQRHREPSFQGPPLEIASVGAEPVLRRLAASLGHLPHDR
jgi:hypothetical protein